MAVLASVAVKGRAPLTGYSREQFGAAWADVDHDGCDTRDQVLAEQLTHVVRLDACRVASGDEIDPYTRTALYYVRGHSTVDIDHVVAEGDAWQTGGQQLTAAQREAFANDPLNLIAVSASANRQKGDADAASWLPKNKSYRCAYVARQVAVKHRYGLWMTAAEHSAIGRVLAGCPSEAAPGQAAGRAAAAPARPSSSAPPSSHPAPTAPGSAPAAPSTPPPSVPPPTVPPSTVPPSTVPPSTVPPSTVPPSSSPADVYYANCDAVRAAGKAPLHVGDPGYRTGLDRDHDGVACE